jgi:uncharacterized protein (DUF433 family)
MNGMIESDPKVLQGKPVVKGTRITVETILQKLAAGESKADLLEAHPRLTLEGIHAALAFAAAVLRLYVSDQQSVELSAEWREEIERRTAEVDAGTVELIPGDVVLRKARERLRELREDRARVE